MPDDGNRYEVIDGMLIVTPAPGWHHQEMGGALYVHLRADCPRELRVMIAPFALRTAHDSEVQPDVLVTRYVDLTPQNLPVAPLLVVETLSPSTQLHDRNTKKAHYERMGVPSYWLLDPPQRARSRCSSSATARTSRSRTSSATSRTPRSGRSRSPSCPPGCWTAHVPRRHTAAPGGVGPVMRAVQYDEFGGVDVLRVAEVPVPEPGPDEVLVEVAAAGINPGEAYVREGRYAQRWPSTFPSGQGSDLAGTVRALGLGVDAVAVGDEVFGWTDLRASQAEYVGRAGAPGPREALGAGVGAGRGVARGRGHGLGRRARGRPAARRDGRRVGRGGRGRRADRAAGPPHRRHGRRRGVRGETTTGCARTASSP
jgi:hypothetical protein